MTDWKEVHDREWTLFSAPTKKHKIDPFGDIAGKQTLQLYKQKPQMIDDTEKDIIPPHPVETKMNYNPFQELLNPNDRETIMGNTETYPHPELSWVKSRDVAIWLIGGVLLYWIYSS